MLGLAVALLAVPVACRALALVGLVAHAVARRPARGPGTIELCADGSCTVPEWGAANRDLGPDTLVAPFWVRLDLGPGIRPRYIFLFADQMGPEAWRRMRALLFRLRRT